MSRTLLLVSTHHDVGLTSASLGLVRAFDQAGEPVVFVKPIAQLRPGYHGPERSRALVALTTPLEPPEPIEMSRVAELHASSNEQLLLEEVVARVHAARLPSASLSSESDAIVIVEGLVPTEDVPFADRLNAQIAKALDADVVLVGVPEHEDPKETALQFAVAARIYGESAVTGCLLNKVDEHGEDDGGERPSGFFGPSAGARHRLPGFTGQIARYAEALAAHKLHLVGAIPLRRELLAPRVSDLAQALGARILRRGDLSRRIVRTTVAAKSVPAVLRGLQSGVLVIVPADRHDIIMAAALRTLAGTPLSALLLTGDEEPAAEVLELCARAIANGLTILSVPDNTLETALRVMSLDREVPIDDRERAELVMDTVAGHIDSEWLHRSSYPERPRRLSPPAFRHRLIETARAANRRIVLPEGEEPRTIAAAIACQERGIARCVLIGEATRIAHTAADQGLLIPEGLEILSPSVGPEKYEAPLYELRKHKGLTREAAHSWLFDPLVVGTMMLAQGDVDGLVAGAIHTTADTLRPALRLIKTVPGTKLVSSVFFMCLPDQVLVYGDCAVNPDPDAEGLAEIAISSADSASAFGIEPRVALISYSTGSSGSGVDVEKVLQATRIARERRPDLVIDGPLQYDAAIHPEVARTKAPNSPVAGRATVLVFPDLNTGNTTYKAVQRSAQVVSMGPMLQGLSRPVNDLSRGCSVEDIVYTIALTAIQAGQCDKRLEEKPQSGRNALNGSAAAPAGSAT